MSSINSQSRVETELIRSVSQTITKHFRWPELWNDIASENCILHQANLLGEWPLSKETEDKQNFSNSFILTFSFYKEHITFLRCFYIFSCFVRRFNLKGPHPSLLAGRTISILISPLEGRLKFNSLGEGFKRPDPNISLTFVSVAEWEVLMRHWRWRDVRITKMLPAESLNWSGGRSFWNVSNN